MISVQFAPLKNQKEPVDVSKTSSPVAGDEIANRSAVVIRGISIPLSVLITSSIALLSGANPEVLIATWLVIMEYVKKEKKRRKSRSLITRIFLICSFICIWNTRQFTDHTDVPYP